MPRHAIDRRHRPIVIRGYSKLHHVEDLVLQANNGKFARVAYFGAVTLPLLSFDTYPPVITVILNEARRPK